MAGTLSKLQIHVGVISGQGALPLALEAELRNALKRIGLKHPGLPITLHHGCGTGADEAAHRMARDLRWQIAGHPVRRTPGGPYRLPADITRGITVLFPPKSAEERHAHIISQSQFIIAVQPADEQSIALLSRAEAAGRQVTYLGRTSPRHPAIAARPPVPGQPAGPTQPAAAESARRPSATRQQGRPPAEKPVPEARFVTPAAATTLPRVQGTCVHVGVISGGSSIKEAQAAALARELKKIPVPQGGKLILHHGCAQGADTAAHETVQAIKGWEIHGHPASGSANGQPPTGIHRQLHTVHTAKPRDERDADIVRASTIVIFVEPGPPGAKALRAATAANGTIINVPAPARNKQATNAPAPAGKKKIISAPAPARKKKINVPAPAGKKRSGAAQPGGRTRRAASYAAYDAQQARIAELLRKLNQPESLVDTWR